jgi:type I restriction enzyme S subunit
LLERILKERRARWEAKQLAKFREQGKTPPEACPEQGQRGWQDKYPEPVKPDTSNLPELPEGWVWASLDMLGEIVSGVTKGTKRDASIEVKEVPYLRVANVQRGYLDLTEVKTILATKRDIEELTLQAGDVLFNEGGDRDKLGRGWIWRNEVANCIHQNHVFRLRVYLPELIPELISYHGNTFGKTWFQSAGKQTTNLASINMGILRAFPVPVAPSDEQMEILSLLEQQIDALKIQEKSVSIALIQSAAQRKNILKAAFSGQLVQQDPSDEPASVLLERIRAERKIQISKDNSRKRKFNNA